MTLLRHSDTFFVPFLHTFSHPQHQLAQQITQKRLPSREKDDQMEPREASEVRDTYSYPLRATSWPQRSAPGSVADGGRQSPPFEHTETLHNDQLPYGQDNDNEENDSTHEHEEDEQALDEIIGEGQTKYDLRPSARSLKSSFARTWVDDDTTGLYDPSEEQRQLRRRARRPQQVLKSGGFTPWDLNEGSDDGSEACPEFTEKFVPKLEVTLRFASEVGKARFQQHVKSLPVQSDPSEQLFSERRLRRRDSGVGLSRAATPKSGKKHRLLEDFPDDLTGHPLARGCWECLTLGIRCPLLDDPRAWPCTTCVDDDNECELITPPTYKRPCENCKSRRLGCSYTYSLDHDEPCEECSRSGWRCVAGPAKESIRERLSYDRDWEEDPWQAPKPPKAKKLISCRRCRKRGQPCSFASGDKNEICTACDMADQACVPELDTSQSSRKRKRAKHKHQTATKDDDEDEDEDEVNKRNQTGAWGRDIFGPRASKATPIIISDKDPGSSDEDASPPKRAKTIPQPKPIVISETSDSSSDSDSDVPPARQKDRNPAALSSNKGVLHTITTKFAHPIVFNYEGSQTCHFCTDIRFAMFGLGPKEVEVVVWNDGRGLEEISGGHRGRGVENTRMCVACTTQRLPVMMCGRHEVQPLEGEWPATKCPWL